MFIQLYPNDLLIMRSKSGKKLPDSDLKCSLILSIIHNLTYSTSHELSLKNQEFGVSLYSQFLRKILGSQYSKYIKHLIKLDLIEELDSGSYKVGVHSKKYRLKKYTNGGKLGKNKYYDKYINILKSNTETKLTPVKQYVSDKMIETLNTVVSIEKDGIKTLKNKMWNQPFYNCQKSLVQMINSTENIVTTDTSGARLYGAHTTLSKEIRKDLEINGKKTLTFDIKNSQFQFLCLEMSSKGYKENDFIEFSKICHSGKIYEYFMNQLNISDRTIVKKLLINWLYGYLYQLESNKLKLVNNIFISNFPTVYKYIVCQKGQGGKIGSSNFAKRLQDKETSVITYLQSKLFKKSIHNLSVHDSISIDANIKDVDGLTIVEWMLYEMMKVGFDINGIEITNYQYIKEKENISKWLKKIKIEEENKDKVLINKYLGKGKYKEEVTRHIYVAHLTNTNIKSERNKIKEFENIDIDFLKTYKREKSY